MPKVKFTKMHGIGNDYIYFDCIAEPQMVPNPPKTAQKLADRHFGIGGDGIVLILPSDKADYRMRMFNADGSEAEMCGNAIRSVTKYLCDNSYCTTDSVAIETGAGVLAITILREDGKFVSARVDMGEPILNGPDVPVAVEKNPVVKEPVTTDSGVEYAMTCVSMGNPHAVIFVDEITDEHVLNHGKQLEVNPVFPRRINVEFVKVISRSEVQMRVWERGAGETLACGTGASAVCVACVLNDLTDRKVTVHLIGGDLEIEWNADTNHVFMTGPATFVCEGTVEVY